MPKDARPDTLVDDSYAVVENIVAKLLPRRAGVAIFFLDACRTLTPLAPPGSAHPNPIPAQPGFASLGASFAGAVLSFAPGFNEAALSRAHQSDTNSPYTQGLQRHLASDRTSLGEVLDEIGADVERSTGERQHPAYLAQGASVSTIRLRPLTDQQDLRDEENRWRAALATGRPGCVRDYIRKYPQSRFTIAALRWLTEAPAQPPSGPSEGADECRTN